MPYEDSVQNTQDVSENNESAETSEVSGGDSVPSAPPVVEESGSPVESAPVEESQVEDSQTEESQTEESQVEESQTEEAGQVSGNDVGGLGEGELSGSVSGNTVLYDLDNPLPVYMVEEPVPLSLYETNFYQVSDYWKSYFRGVLEKHPGKDYVAFAIRTGSSSSTTHYYLYVGDMEESDGRITGSGLLRYDAYTYDSIYRVSVSNDSLDLHALGYAVYSNLGTDFSELREGGSYVLSFAVLFALCFFVVFGVCRDIFKFILERVYRK